MPFTVSVIPEALQAGVVFDAEVDAESEVIVGSAMGNATEFDLFTLAAGLATATCTVCTAERLAVVTVALSCVGPTKVVASCVTLLPLSVHCTLEHGTKFAPETISEKAEVPAVAPAGAIDAIVGTASGAAEMVNVAGAEGTPEFDTVIAAVPAEAISEAGIEAVSCVALTKIVARAEPFQSTTEAFTKFVPVTVSVNPEGLHEGVVLEDVVEEDSAVIVGVKIENEIPLEVPPPGPWVNASTVAVPAARKSVAGIVAVS